jgi:YidC/Oxa1 family membrane protein insertase
VDLNLWDTIAVRPMANVLIVLSQYLFHNFGLAIIALTLIINGAIYPLTVKQIKSSKAMQDLQPKMMELQKKYAKDKQKLAQEQMKMYREAGMGPAGCILPMLIQMPIWIALYQAVTKLLGVTPEDYLHLSRYLYHWPVVFSTLPLNNGFLWLNLVAPDNLIILPILVGATMWVQQKMVTPAIADPAQQSQNRMMLWMMPIMFAFFTLQFPSGLAIYWVTSSVVRIFIQYFVYKSWGGLTRQALVPATESVVKEGKYKKF